MKAKYLVSAALACSLAASASTISPDEAIAKFQSKGQLNHSLKAGKFELAYTASKLSTAPYYVYKSIDQDGFLILSSDSEDKAVIGYSTNARFDENDIPPALSCLLTQYRSGIQPYTQADKPAIAPLLSTRWNQDEPYNNTLPDFDSGTHTLAGCVGTAVSQMINFYQHPKNPVGSIHYVSGLRHFSADLSEYTFDFSNMIDDYQSGNPTDMQIKSVNDLYYCTCMAVESSWGYDVTTAKSSIIPEKLVQHFCYSDDIGRVSSSYFSPNEWCDLIYSQLAKGLPVIMSANQNSTDVGHVFICDGYDGNGCFHINWGWGGALDGYFNLSSLYAYDPSIDFSTEGYSVNQYAIINVYPQDSHTIPDYVFTVDGFSVPEITVNLGSTVYLSSHYNKCAGPDTHMRVGLKFINTTTGTVTYIAKQQEGLYYDWAQPIPEEMDEGEYLVYPCVYLCDTDRWVDVHQKTNNKKHTFATVKDSRVTFSKLSPNASVSVSNPIYPEVIFPGGTFSAHANLVNDSDEDYFNQIALCVCSKSADGSLKVLSKSASMPVYIAKGETRSVHLSGSMKQNIGIRDDLFICFMYYYDYQYADQWIAICEPEKISSVEYTAGNLVIDSINLIKEPDELSPTMTIETILHCEDGYFNGEIQMELVECDEEGNLLEPIDSEDQSPRFASPVMYDVDDCASDSKKPTAPSIIIGRNPRPAKISRVSDSKIKQYSPETFNPNWPKPVHWYRPVYSYYNNGERIKLLGLCLLLAWAWDTVLDQLSTDTISTDDISGHTYYDLTGRKIECPSSPGIYIRTSAGPEKKTEKIILR